MSGSPKATSANKPKVAKPRKPTKQAPSSTRLEGSPDAKRLGSVILEVLSGLRTPAEASVAVGVSIPRYYYLEARALQGLITALEKRSPGAQQRPDVAMRKLTQERDRLSRELRRALALVRVAQRAVGLPSTPERGEKASKGTATPKGKRKRKPRVRARKVVATLREQAARPAAPAARSAADSAPASEPAMAPKQPPTRAATPARESRTA